MCLHDGSPPKPAKGSCNETHNNVTLRVSKPKIRYYEVYTLGSAKKIRIPYVSGGYMHVP